MISACGMLKPQCAVAAMYVAAISGDGLSFESVMRLRVRFVRLRVPSRR